MPKIGFVSPPDFEPVTVVLAHCETKNTLFATGFSLRSEALMFTCRTLFCSEKISFPNASG